MSYRKLHWMCFLEGSNMYGAQKSWCCQWVHAALPKAGAQLATRCCRLLPVPPAPNTDRPCVGAAFQA